MIVHISRYRIPFLRCDALLSLATNVFLSTSSPSSLRRTVATLFFSDALKLIFCLRLARSTTPLRSESLFQTQQNNKQPKKKSRSGYGQVSTTTSRKIRRKNDCVKVDGGGCGCVEALRRSRSRCGGKKKIVDEEKQ